MAKQLKVLKKVLLKKVARDSNFFTLQALKTISFIGLCLVSCKTVNPSYDRGNTVLDIRSEIVSDARSLIGSSYKYAGKGPKNFDCSGLVGYVYGLSDVRVTGSSSSLSDQAKAIDISKSRPGDLIFFKKEGRVFHVSIISKIRAGELWVVHSTSSRGVIEQEILSSSYWRPLIYKTVSLSSY